MTQEVLKMLHNKGIFSIEKKEDGNFIVTEACDDYFSVSLTPAELMQLTVELRQLLND